jgi:hypothetical protein
VDRRRPRVAGVTPHGREGRNLIEIARRARLLDAVCHRLDGNEASRPSLPTLLAVCTSRTPTVRFRRGVARSAPRTDAAAWSSNEFARPSQR